MSKSVEDGDIFEKGKLSFPTYVQIVLTDLKIKVLLEKSTKMQMACEAVTFTQSQF